MTVPLTLAGVRPRRPSLVRDALSTLFSFETLFVAFLFAGRYKGDERFSTVGVDLTALFFVLSGAVGLVVFLQNRGAGWSRGRALVLAYWVFLVYSLASLGWTSGRLYAVDKAGLMTTLVFWPLLAGALIIAPDPERRTRLSRVVMAFGVWFAAESLLVYATTTTGGMVNALGGNYLGLGRALSLGLVFALAVAIFAPLTPTRRALVYGSVCLFAWTLLVLGGRGPLLATGVAALVPLFYGTERTERGTVRIRGYVWPLLLVLGAAIGGLAYLVTSGGLTTTLERFMLLLGDSGSLGTSANERTAFWTQSLALWEGAPIFGSGIGSWPIRMGMGDIRNYPHNIVLEVMVEQGLAGLTLLLTLVVLAFRRLTHRVKLRHDAARLTVLMLFVNVLGNAMVSGDLSDNRVFFLVLGLMAFPVSTPPSTTR